jgi:hypothetical protein
MAATADKINYTKDSFQDQNPGAVAPCPFAGGPPPTEPTPPVETVVEPVEMKIFPGETEQNAVTSPVAPAKKVEEKKAWIEIVLVDMDGNPMPGVKYRITPPSGEPKEDFLNEYGQGGYFEIEPGTCKVSFPDLDKDAWE